MTLYLRKANNDVLSFCGCDPKDALVAHPGQLDCPWCGCGFLFSCWKCRRAFTFAEAFETELTLDDIVRRDFEAFLGPRDAKEYLSERGLKMRKHDIERMLQGVELGGAYVYLDGYAHRVGQERSFVGVYGRHALSGFPWLRPGASADTLQRDFDRDYWELAAAAKSLKESRA